MSRAEFTEGIGEAAWKRCEGHCEGCGRAVRRDEVELDHEWADGLGGPATLDNCKVLCRQCHRVKTSTHDIPLIAKGKRVKRRHDEHKERMSKKECGRSARVPSRHFRRNRTPVRNPKLRRLS